MYIVCVYIHYYTSSKEVGKQSSELRMTFTWRRVVWDFTSDDFLPDEGRCETLYLMTFTRWRVVWDFISDDFYLMNGGVRLEIWWLLPDEGWCETLHLMTFTWWRVVWDFTSDDFYLMKGGVRHYIWWLLPDEGWCETLHLMTFTWWRAVWDITSDDFYLMKGNVRLYILHGPREVVTKGSGDLGSWLHDYCHVLLPCSGTRGCEWHCKGCMDVYVVLQHDCNGCIHVAWGVFWGGSRSTKPCVFPCKVAAGGDEGYLLCAAVMVWIVSTA